MQIKHCNNKQENGVIYTQHNWEFIPVLQEKNLKLGFHCVLCRAALTQAEPHFNNFLHLMLHSHFIPLFVTSLLPTGGSVCATGELLLLLHAADRRQCLCYRRAPVVATCS
jgi:hypothetical protein